MASFVPPLYSKLGKSLSDLLKKKFEYDSKINSRNAVNQELTVESAANLTEKGNYGVAMSRPPTKTKISVRLRVKSVPPAC
jgi:hypothetical protein